jgi:cholesterol transport system auxiliary component
MTTTPRWSRRLFAAAAALSAAGCASLLVSPPRRLYRLTPAASFPPGMPRATAQLLVDAPDAPAGLDTDRIALSRSPLSLDYFADAEWADRAPLLVEAALVSSFEASGAIAAVGRESSGLHADFILQSEIRHFEAEYLSEGGSPAAFIAIGVKLVAMPQRAIVGQAAFEHKTPAAANDVPAVVGAFDQALSAVMRDIVVWTLGNPALSAPRRRV